MCWAALSTRKTLEGGVRGPEPINGLVDYCKGISVHPASSGEPLVESEQVGDMIL